MGIINYAQEVYRSDADQSLVPRQRYNFTLTFERFDEQPIVFHRVQNATVPGYSVDGQLMNQYNKKRFVQTRLNYDPVVVTFYDTYDNQWQNMMRDYLAHYYNGENGIEFRTTLEGTSTVDPNFETDLGFTPNSDRYFFPRIILTQNGYRRQYRETILINPHITAIQGDALDYSDSNPTVYTVTFQPESVQTRNQNTQFDDNLNTE